MQNKPKAGLAIQVLPKTMDDKNIEVVDKVINFIQTQNVSMFVGPFETTIEGDFDKIWDIAKECQLICIKEGAYSVSTYIKVFYSPEGVLSTDDKISKYNN